MIICLGSWSPKTLGLYNWFRGSIIWRHRGPLGGSDYWKVFGSLGVCHWKGWVTGSWCLPLSPCFLPCDVNGFLWPSFPISSQESKPMWPPSLELEPPEPIVKITFSSFKINCFKSSATVKWNWLTLVAYSNHKALREKCQISKPGCLVTYYMLYSACPESLVTHMWGQPTQRQCSSGHHKLGLQMDPRHTGSAIHKAHAEVTVLSSLAGMLHPFQASSTDPESPRLSLEFVPSFLTSCPRMVLLPCPSLLKDTVYDNLLGFQLLHKILK